jgi:hypothetical protein
MSEHVQYICKCTDNPYCMFCEGGLYACTVCGGFEGSLPTDCPGYWMGEDLADAVYAGVVDYRAGRSWTLPDGTGKSMGDYVQWNANQCGPDDKGAIFVRQSTPDDPQEKL